jgi:hypothetical protein
MAHRKFCEPQLGLGNVGQKVGLILVRIGAFEEIAGAIGIRSLLAVMPGGEAGAAQFPGVVGQKAEFDVLVAEDVRIGGQAVPIALHQGRCNPPAVALDHVDDRKGDLELLSDASGLLQILFPGTGTERPPLILVVPGAHVGSQDFRALSPQEQGRHGTVHATGQGDEPLPICLRPLAFHLRWGSVHAFREKGPGFLAMVEFL